MIRRAALASLFALPLVLAASAGGAPGETATSADAHATAVRLAVPGQAGGAAGVVAAPPDAVSFGSYAYPADGSVLSVGSITANASASTAGGSIASASADVSSVSLFGGEVTVDAVAARATASAQASPATGSFDGAAVTNLIVLGQPVAAASGATVQLGDWGYAVVLQQQGSASGSGAPTFTGSMTGLLVHLNVDHGGLPAGSEIALGYADAAAEGPAAPAPPPPPPPPAPPPPPPTPPTPPPPPPPTTTGSLTTPTLRPPPPPAEPTRPSTEKPAKPKPVVKPPAEPSEKAKPTVKPHKPPEPVEAGPGRPPPVVHAPPQNIHPKLTAGGYVFPVYGACSYTDSFGSPRADVSYHHGEDIFAPLGTPLLAVADGVVFSVGWNHLGGYRLWLRDLQGNEFYYAHLSAYSPLAVNGRFVHAGDVLGFMGNTGDAVGTPFHLHFEIHPVSLLYLGYDGAVAPYEYLNAWRRVQDLRISPAAVSTSGWAPSVPAPRPGEPQAPPPALVIIQVNDISSVNGLERGALRRALLPVSAEGDGALVNVVQAPPSGARPVRR